MPATAIPTSIKLADYTVSTLLLTTVDPRETELIFMEKAKKGGSWTAINAMVLDLSGVTDTRDLEEFDYERLRRQAASYGIVLAGVVAERDKTRSELILKGRGRFISPRITALSGNATTKVTSKENETATNPASQASSQTSSVSATAAKNAADEETGNNQTPNAQNENSKSNVSEASSAPGENKSSVNSEAVNASESKVVDDSNNAAASTAANIPMPPDGATVIHTGNVRSGTQIYAQNKSLIIFGNVGDGAEVIADDCVFIFGRALGRIVAGVKNKDCIVFCKSFNPQLVSINGVYCTADDLRPDCVDQSVLVRLKDGKLDFEPQN